MPVLAEHVRGRLRHDSRAAGRVAPSGALAIPGARRPGQISPAGAGHAAGSAGRKPAVSRRACLL